MTPTRRHVARLGLMGLAAPLLPRLARAEGEPAIKVPRRLTNPSIAVNDGPFATRYGLKIVPVSSSTGVEVNETLLTGTIEVGEIGITPFVTLAARSPEVVAIGVANTGGGMYRTVVGVDSPFRSMDDLRGRTVAIRVGSGNYAAFLTYIKSRGWKETDFRIVNAGDQEAISALAGKSVDAVIYWEPIVSTLIAKGIARPIFSFKGVVENPVFIATTRRVIAEKPDALARYIATYMDAQAFLANDVPAAAELVTKVMRQAGQQVDPQVIALSIPVVDYRIDLDDGAKAEALANYKLLSSSGKLRGREPDWANAFDDRFIKAAAALRAKKS